MYDATKHDFFGGRKMYVNVYNLQAEIVLDNGEVLNEKELTDSQREAIEKLKSYIIYTVNHGAINFSGEYEFNEIAYEIFNEIMSGNTDAIAEIRDVEEEDIEKRAEELIQNLEDDELIEVYDSGLHCSDYCRGYHNRKFISKRGGEFLLVDNGYGHHVAFSIGRRVVASLGVTTEKISKEEAIEMLKEHLRELTKKYNFTVRELKNISTEIYTLTRLLELSED